MLVIAVDNVLQFINVCNAQPRYADLFICQSEIVDFSLSWNDDYALCIERKNAPEVICIRDLNSNKARHNIEALENISTGKFRRKKPSSLVIGTNTSFLGIYDVSHKKVVKVRSMPGPVVDIDLNIADDKLFVGCRNGLVVVLEVLELVKIHVYNVNSLTKAIQLHPSLENMFLVHGVDGVLNFFDLEQPDVTKRLEFTGGVKAFGIVPDTMFVITLGDVDRYKCSIYDLEEGIFLFHHHLSYEPTSLSISGHHFVLGTDTGLIAIFDCCHILTPWLVIEFSAVHIGALKVLNQFKFADTPEADNASSLATKSTRHNLLDYENRNKKKHTLNQGIVDNRIVFRDCTEEVIVNLKKEILDSVRISAAEAQAKMRDELAKFQLNLNKEFLKVTNYSCSCWNNLIIPSNSRSNRESM